MVSSLDVMSISSMMKKEAQNPNDMEAVILIMTNSTIISI